MSEASPPAAAYKLCPRCSQIYGATNNFCVRDRTPLVPDSRIIVGKYILLKKIGYGRMSDVYLAEQPHLGRKVAIKLLNRTPEVMRRFDTEVLAGGRIKHDHVVTIHDSGWTEDGSPYIAMEYLNGSDLATSILQRGPLPSERAMLLWMQAVRAIAAAHRSKVIHRDIKPANLFVTAKDGDDGPEQIIKVIDFSIAKVLDSTVEQRPTQPGTLLGTVHYMAPEQLKRGEATPCSDVYSLGLVLVEMLTGTIPPAKPADRNQVSVALLRMVNQSSGSLELSPQRPLSAGLLQLAGDVLSPEPENRPADAIELLRRIKDLPEMAEWRKIPRRLAVTGRYASETASESSGVSKEPSVDPTVRTRKDRSEGFSVTAGAEPTPSASEAGLFTPSALGVFPGEDFPMEEPTLPSAREPSDEVNVRALLKSLSVPRSSGRTSTPRPQAPASSRIEIAEGNDAPDHVSEEPTSPSSPISFEEPSVIKVSPRPVPVPVPASVPTPAVSVSRVVPPTSPRTSEVDPAPGPDPTPTPFSTWVGRPKNYRHVQDLFARALAIALIVMIPMCLLGPRPECTAPRDLGESADRVFPDLAPQGAGTKPVPVPVPVPVAPPVAPAAAPADMRSPGVLPQKEEEPPPLLPDAGAGSGSGAAAERIKVRFVIRDGDGVVEIRCRGVLVDPGEIIELGPQDSCVAFGPDGAQRTLSYEKLAKRPPASGGVRRHHERF